MCPVLQHGTGTDSAILFCTFGTFAIRKAINATWIYCAIRSSLVLAQKGFKFQFTCIELFDFTQVKTVLMHVKAMRTFLQFEMGVHWKMFHVFREHLYCDDMNMMKISSY